MHAPLYNGFEFFNPKCSTHCFKSHIVSNKVRDIGLCSSIRTCSMQRKPYTKYTEKKVSFQ